MANPAWSDMETIFTTSQLRALSDDEVWTSMIDAMAEKPTGTEALLSVANSEGETERIPYVFDGDQYWHRGDLRMADMQRKIGQRLAALREKSDTSPPQEEAPSGS